VDQLIETRPRALLILQHSCTIPALGRFKLRYKKEAGLAADLLKVIALGPQLEPVFVIVLVEP
jgi:hypothetical protein